MPLAFSLCITSQVFMVPEFHVMGQEVTRFPHNGTNPAHCNPYIGKISIDFKSLQILLCFILSVNDTDEVRHFF